MKISTQLNCLRALLLLCMLYSFSFLETTSKQIVLTSSNKVWADYYHSYQISDCENEAVTKQQLKQFSKDIITQIRSTKSTLSASVEVFKQIVYTEFSSANTQLTAISATCPTIRVQELQGVPNFSETDQLVICGAADTLAYLIYIEEPGNISGTQLTLDFKPGMQYAGFQLTHYDGTAISVVDDTPEKPRFLLDGITEGVYVAYVGVETTCEANIDAIDYTVDLKFNFIYEDTLGTFASCKQVVSPDRSYNTTIREPVLNFRTASNISITSLGTQKCTNIWLSQDGIKANLSEFNFAVKNLDLTGNLNLNSVKANNRVLDYTYDDATKTLQATPNGFHFENNRFPAPDDELFDTGEQIYVQLCFQVDECPDFSSQLLTYLASYGCNGDTCQFEQTDVLLSVTPTTRPEPIVTSSLDQNPSVCGNPGIINLTVTSNQQDSAFGLFQDLTLGFETCEKPSLDIAKVIIGTAPNTTEITSENFSWEGTDLKIDFTDIEDDPDGDGIGITDADGDGFYDDLPGGKLLNIAIELDFTCTEPTSATSLNCSNLDCSFSTFYVKARRDCGQSFTAYPEVDDFQITNGATYVGNNQTEISNSLYGINFGATGTSGAKTKKVVFDYIYNRENVTPCANEFASNKLKIIYNGTPAIVQDIQLKPNSIKLNGVAVDDSKATWTNMSLNTRILVIDAGLNILNDTVRYEYELTVDTTLCTPPIYMEGSHQVIETCNTGDCECQTVLACDKLLFRSDPNATGCDCVMRSRLVDMYRESTGYTDETMTEKVQPEDVLPADRNRYLPGDTMVYEAGYRLNTTEAFTDIYEWGMGFRILDAGFISGRSTPNLELIMDAAKTELRTFEIKKAGTNNRIAIDFSDIPACLDDDIAATSVHGISMYYGTSPWDNTIYSRFQRYSGNSSYDYYDNARIYIQIRNQTKLQECRNVNYSSWADNGNCWDDFNAKYQFQVGDSLFLKVGIPFTKNPHRVLANQTEEAPGIPLVYQDTWVTSLDEFVNNCTVGLSTCRENVPFQTYCPSEVVAKTDLQIDDCGGMATHTFTVDNTTPINWYTEEYRPYFQMQNLDVPIYSPMMYCGNAKGTTKGGVEFPLSLRDTSNHTCVIVGGQSYCSVSASNQGTVTFNPQAEGFPGLGVGLGGFRDSFKVSYDLCMICPGEIPNLANYEIVYDYQYRGDPPNGFSYRCNFSAADPTTAEIEECAALGNGYYYYNEWMLDTLMIKSDNTSSDKTLDDQRLGFPKITQTLDRNLFSSAIPGSSEEINTIVICADSSDLSKPTHQGVMATVKLSNSVALKNIYDENDVPLNFAYVTTDGTTSTYRTSLPNLAAGDKIIIKLGTTLLFCPIAPLPPPEICVNITSGCMDPEIQAAVVGNTESCTANEVCYAYVFGEAAIQADFLTPSAGNEYPLCGDIPVAILIKNVKKVTVTDLTAVFDLPITGAQVVSGSFQASYPNAGDFSKPFYDIADPVINDTQLSYTEDEVFSPAIHSNGLPGISALQDSNQIVIQFLMKTVCDSFVSGSKLRFEATAADPCSVDILSTGTVVSDATIIENANPKDFAQILTTAEPAEAYCGSTDTEFTLTGQNISQKPSGDSIQICLTFPEELVYQDNSIAYAIPSGKSVGTVSNQEIQGQTQICFAGVNNLPLGGQFTLKFKATMPEEVECGMADIGIQIKELVPDQVCVADGSLCDVFVQSSVNDAAGITLKAPLETIDLALTRKCSDSEDPVTVCFEAKLYNPGLDYTGDINIDLHDDLLSNQILDDYDPILANKLFDDQYVAAGDTIILSGCFELEELNACPVFVNIRYETACNCYYDTEYFNTIAPDFIAELPSTTVLCEGMELGIATCGNYTYNIDATADGYMRTVGDSIYFGLNNPANELSITVQGGIGACDYQETLFLKGLEPFTPYLKDTEACINTPAYLQLVIPTKYEDEATIRWTPSTNLDDPTILDPIFTAPTAGIYNYTVEIILGNDCIISEDVAVNVQSTSELSIVSEVGYCLANPLRKLTTDTGFDKYEWYILEGGFEIIQAVTTTNFWAGPSKGGIYFVKGYKTGVLCPSVSPTELIPDAKCPSLGNLVWADTNNDGLFTNESGIENVEVTLYNLGPDGQKGGGDDMLIAIDTTDVNGLYLFTNLDTGSYYVALTDGIPVGMTSSNGTGINGQNNTLYEPAPDPDNDINNDDNGTENQGIICSHPVTINLEAEPTDDGDNDNSSNLTVDFGLIPTSSLGDYVWEDINGDGIQNDGATGIENIQVILTGTDGSGQQFSDTTYTDAIGFYLFDNLLPGMYEVTFGQPNGFEFTGQNEGVGSAQDSLDSDANENGLTQTITLSLNEHNPTLDAGIYQPASLGDYVWQDTNADGIQNDGATGVENVQVILIGTDGLGNPVSDTTYTDGNGFYEFTNLVPGDYAVQFVNPTDFNFSMSNTGTGISQDSLDSDADPITGLTQTVTLISGKHNPTLDAGIYEYASIGDYVWIDVNADGLQNEGDSTGLANVSVFLSGVNGAGDSILLMTTTDANGVYLFDGLLPGEYQVSFEIPTQYKVTLQQVGIDSLIDSNTDSLGIAMREILISGEHNPSYDLGLIPDFDLALIIQLAPGENRDIVQGDTVTFNIFLENQGVADAFDVSLRNYVPTSLIFDNNLNQTYNFQGNQWQADSSLTFNQLLVGESVAIPMQLIVGMNFTDSLIINHAEIIGGSRVSGNGINAIDIDSHPDSNNDDIIGGNNFLDNHYNDEDDHDFSYLVYLMEVDPLGYIYCDKTGHILKGGTISVSTPPRGVVYLAMDGSTGMYQWWTNGIEGVYTMSYTHPSGFPLSTKCLPQPGIYDPTGRDGAAEDQDGIAGNRLISLGTSLIVNDAIVDTSCANNPYYLDFHLASGDPFIDNNHIPVQCSFISSIVCEDKNGNGVQDEGEVFLEGIEVNLYNCADTLNPIATTLSDADGVYEFDGLSAGDYMVQFVPPTSHRFALDATPIGIVEQRGGFSQCTTLNFGECDTTINMHLVPCAGVTITPSVQTTYFGQSLTATASGGEHFKWTPDIDIDCDTCQTVRITPTESRIYTVTADDAYGCNNSAALKVNVLYSKARIYNPCECEFDNFLNPTGNFNEQIVILSTIPNETWTLVENNGILSTTNSLVSLGTNFSNAEKEGLFYKYILDIKHQDGIGYNGKVSNGTDSYAVGNICFSENSCRVIIPPTDSTGTPPPPVLGCVDIINASNTTPAVSTLENCEGCEFRSEEAEDAVLYRDDSTRNNVHTIHPPNQWQRVMTTFTHFDLAAGDILYVFDGPDTLSNLLGKYSGTGVSQTNGWVAASCQPAINPTGSLTFQFKTNGDRRKGTGWIANNTCLSNETTLTAANNLQAKLTCGETNKVFTINPATVTSNCSAIQDSQLVKIYDKHRGLCVETILAHNKNFQKAFAIGEYSIEYLLKTDTVKTARTEISVQGPNLVCNDKVTVPLGSGCSIMLSPDDLLENPCDTITDTLYYHITLEYVNKKGDKQAVSGGGKGGQYPIISKEMLGECGGQITATIEKRYYEGLNLSFCNNGTTVEKCAVEVAITDESKPWILEMATIDTFVVCQIDLTEKGLGLPTPKATDNCSEATVIFNGANIISQGSEVCDTTKVAVEWLATDACGNSASATQTVVFVRPSITNLVKTKNDTLTCDGENNTVGEIPSLQIGQWKNGQLIPSDTIPLSTEEYICGYILQKTEVAIPATDCGKKLFRYWSVLDWCAAENGPKVVDTTLVDFLDTIPPAFENNDSLVSIELDHASCSYDISEIAIPKAKDNCSIPSVRLDRISSIENDSLWTIPTNEWATLENDSFELRWIAADICHEQLINDTFTQILLLKDITKPSAICNDNIKVSLGQDNALLHYRDVDGGSFDACGIIKYEVSRNEVNWDSIVRFDCEDIHKDVTIYLRVTDKNGNQNTCWMTVNVEDKIMPICSDLPNAKGTCEENHLADLGVSTDVNDNGLLDDEWKDMTVSQINLFNTNYGNPVCSDNISCGSLIIQQQYQLVPKKCGEIDIQRRFRAIDWDGKGNISNWSTQNIRIESKAAWSITLPSDWTGHCNQTIPDSEVFIINGACDLMAYEVEEKVFTATADACKKVIRTFTITNCCNYEVGQPTLKITRDESIHGKVTFPRIISATEFENVGRLEYIQILESKEVAQTDMASVSGIIMDWKGQTVEDVVVKTATTTEMMTQADGFYNFELPMNNLYNIQPQKKEAPLNGVNTFDLVLISKHILGITQFDNPYQMIAADANKSGSITAFDMVQIRQLILNIKTEFTNNESWRFVDASYAFTTNHPLAENFSEVIQIADLQHNLEMDFVAIKVGDVNGNARTNSLIQAEERTTFSTFEITTTDKLLKAGETYTIAFSTKQLNTIQGYQFTLGYEDLKLEQLNSGVVGKDHFGLHKMEEGFITTSWNQSVVGSNSQSSTIDNESSTVLFNIQFTALKDGKLSEQLSLGNRPTTIEAYDKEDNLMEVKLTFTPPTADAQFELFQNEPNPFYDKTAIGFYLPIDSEVELILRDESGKVLKTIKQDRTAGYNTIQLEIEDLSNGFIYYQLSTEYHTKTKKMIQLK